MTIKLPQELSPNSTQFKAIIIPKEKIRRNILNKLNETQLTELKTILQEQQKNPVNAIIDSKNLYLNAKIFCQYRLQNFKEKYKQIPFLESKLDFIKRVIKKCDEYKKQLNINQSL